MADEVIWATDDGSFGFSGNVVQLLQETVKSTGEKPDLSHVIGPIPMMRAAAAATAAGDEDPGWTIQSSALHDRPSSPLVAAARAFPA